MDLRSEAQLALVCPVLADKARAASSALGVNGTFLLVVQGFRTADYQNALWDQGRKDSRHIVTNARAEQSMHCYGLAVDIVPYLSGANGALNWNIHTPQYQAVIAALKGQGLVYGGDWVHFPDGDHWQLPGFPVTPDAHMQAVYAQGGDAYRTLWPTA